MEFLGSAFCSEQVNVTLSQDVITEISHCTDEVKRKMMFVVTAVSFFLVMLSSVGAMPISGTHATIGAFLGAGWIGTSFYDLGWSKLGNIVISWITAPLLSGIISYIIFIAVMRLTIE